MRGPQGGRLRGLMARRPSRPSLRLNAWRTTRLHGRTTSWLPRGLRCRSLYGLPGRLFGWYSSRLAGRISPWLSCRLVSGKPQRLS